MKIIIIIFNIFGISFSAIGSYLSLSSWDIILNGQFTIGKVVDLEYSTDGMAAPIVNYDCFGNNYENKSGLYSNPHPNIGDTIELYCSKTNPNAFVINNFIDKYFGLIFIVFGVIFLMIPIGVLTYQIKRKKFIEQIRLTGKIIQAPVSSISLNTYIRVNGIHPYFFEIQYNNPSNNSFYTFKSDNFYYNIEKFLKIGDMVKVYVDENNYKKYWVDTSFLTEEK